MSDNSREEIKYELFKMTQDLEARLNHYDDALYFSGDTARSEGTCVRI
jgi:hypothetical protein